MINLDETPENKEVSPGKLLLQGRLQVGLTQDQVAKELYLTVSKVIALEADDFARVGPDTFVRGYIRAYANILKLDAGKVIAAYDQCTKEKLQLSANVAMPVSVNSNKRMWKFVALIAATFLGLWLISIWFFHSPTEHSAKATNFTLPSADTPSLAISVDNFVAASVAGTANLAGTETAEQQSSAAVELLAASSLSVEAQASSIPAAVAVTSVSATTALVTATNKSSKKSTSATSAAVVVKSSTASASASADLAIKKTGLDEISFTFRGECWLEVSDSRGDVLATELQAAKSKLNLVGKAPFDVKLGNANVVSIQLNGKKIAVTPVPGNKVLSLKVSDN